MLKITHWIPSMEFLRRESGSGAHVVKMAPEDFLKAATGYAKEAGPTGVHICVHYCPMANMACGTYIQDTLEDRLLCIT
jgi:hypothetical protein